MSEGGGKDAQELLNVRGAATAERTRAAAAVDALGRVLTNPVFFLTFLLAHLLWVVVNLPVVPWWEPWDPYPFVFLATVASAEAPVLALLILIHQRREMRIDELRGEVDLQVALQVEREASTILRMLEELHRHLGVESAVGSDRLRAFQQDLDPHRLMERVKEHLEEVEGSGVDRP